MKANVLFLLLTRAHQHTHPHPLPHPHMQTSTHSGRSEVPKIHSGGVEQTGLAMAWSEYNLSNFLSLSLTLFLPSSPTLSLVHYCRGLREYMISELTTNIYSNLVPRAPSDLTATDRSQPPTHLTKTHVFNKYHHFFHYCIIIFGLFHSWEIYFITQYL